MKAVALVLGEGTTDEINGSVEIAEPTLNNTFFRYCYFFVNEKKLYIFGEQMDYFQGSLAIFVKGYIDGFSLSLA